MAVDIRLVNKGRKEPLVGLLEDGAVHVTLAKEFATELAEQGWTAADTKAMEEAHEKLKALMAGQSVSKTAALATTVDQEAAIDVAKELLRRLRNALPRVLREPHATGIGLHTFATTGTPLNRSAPRLVAYLNNIAPHVAQLEHELRPFFGGKSASRLLADAQAQLERADATQETAIDALPHETAQVYELKGRLLELIEDLNRTGRNAFYGQAEIAARFNKDRILRARRRRAQGLPEEAETNEAKTTAE